MSRKGQRTDLQMRIKQMSKPMRTMLVLLRPAQWAPMAGLGGSVHVQPGDEGRVILRAGWTVSRSCSANGGGRERELSRNGDAPGRRIRKRPLYAPHALIVAAAPTRCLVDVELQLEGTHREEIAHSGARDGVQHGHVSRRPPRWRRHATLRKRTAHDRISDAHSGSQGVTRDSDLAAML